MPSAAEAPVVGNEIVPTAPNGPASAPFCGQVKVTGFPPKALLPDRDATTHRPFIVVSPVTPPILTVEPTCCVSPSCVPALLMVTVSTLLVRWMELMLRENNG